MAEKKDKPKLIHSSDSINDLVNDFYGLKDKDFKDRIEGYEKFLNPKNQYDLKIQNHAHDLIMGDSETGVYHRTYKIIDETIKDEKKVQKEEIEKIFEQYVDEFLNKVHPEFDDAVKKAKVEGLSDKDIRKLKGNLFSNYNFTKDGKGLNILSGDYIKDYEGKTKEEIKEEIRNLANTSISSYSLLIKSKAIGDLMKQEDHLKLYDHVSPKFKVAGYEHKDHLLTKDYQTLKGDYDTHLIGGDMSKRGYKVDTQKAEKEYNISDVVNNKAA